MKSDEKKMKDCQVSNIIALYYLKLLANSLVMITQSLLTSINKIMMLLCKKMLH